MDNLEEMDKFLEKYNFLKLNQEEIEKLIDPSQEIKTVIRNLPTNKKQTKRKKKKSQTKTRQLHR